MDYAELQGGQTVSRRSIRLDENTVDAYLDAVGDVSRPIPNKDGQPLAAPMAIAALTLGRVVDDMGIPGGTVHGGQELEFQGSVEVGETLECKATVAGNSVRGQWRFVVVQLAVTDSNDRQVMAGKSTIMVPA